MNTVTRTLPASTFTRFSARLVGSLALLTVASLGVGCVDAKGQFDDFVDRVPDATEVVHVDAMPLIKVPDISGSFFLGLAASLNPSTPISFIMTNTFTATADGGTLTTHVIALDKTAHTPVGAETVISDVPVNSAGEFVLHVTTMTVPAAANPITGTDFTATIDLSASIHSVDRFCGDVPSGKVTQPIPVDVKGSTFGAVRIAPGTEGSALPPLESACPPVTAPDAGGASGAH